MSFLKSLDIFSYRFGFLYKGQPEYKTALGGSLSIFIVIFLGFVAYLQSENLIYKLNPRISIKDDMLDKPAGILLSQNTVVLGFKVEDLKIDDLLSNNLFKTEITYYDDYTNKLTTIIDKTIKFVPCRSLSGYKFEDLLKNNIELYVNGLCLKFPPGKVYDLKNSMINIGFYCNSSKDENCLYNQEFQEKLLDKLVTFYYLGINVDIDETKNFFVTRLDSFEVIINPLLNTKTELFYQFTKVESDFGIVSQDLSDEITISATGYSLNNIFNYKLNLEQKDYRDTIKLFNLDMYVKNNRKTYRRIYYKLQNLFAELGGIINICLIFGKLLVSLYNKKSFEVDIIDEVFNLNEVQSSKKFDIRNESEIENKFEKKDGNLLNSQNTGNQN